MGQKLGDFILRHTKHVNKQNKSAVIIGRRDKFQLGNPRSFSMALIQDLELVFVLHVSIFIKALEVCYLVMILG